LITVALEKFGGAIFAVLSDAFVFIHSISVIKQPGRTSALKLWSNAPVDYSPTANSLGNS
jgi:hypothetical protein